MISWSYILWALLIFIILIIIRIFEIISTRLFLFPFFKWGIPWFKKTIVTDKTAYSFPALGKVEHSEGLFFFKNDTVYFRSKKFWFKFLRIHSPLSFKACCKINSKNNIEITGKLPITVVLLQIAWIALILSITSLFDNFTVQVVVLLFILLLLTINTVMFLSLEKERFKKGYEELVTILREYK